MTRRRERPHEPAPAMSRGANLATLPRCGAKTRRGTPCKRAALPNGRCRLHGGLSTGPRTEDGRKRMQAAKTRHGRYSKAQIEERRRLRQLIADCRATLALLSETETTCSGKFRGWSADSSRD